MAADSMCDHVKEALRACGAIVLHAASSKVEPAKLTFETAQGIRAGILVYQFAAVLRDEDATSSTQPLRGSRRRGATSPIPLEQDAAGLYTTLLMSVDPQRGIFIGADPVLHSPMRRGMKIPYAQENADSILKQGWDVWEYDPQEDDELGPIEILVGFRKESFLRFVFFEREALGEDAGHRHMLAERCFTRRSA